MAGMITRPKTAPSQSRSADLDEKCAQRGTHANSPVTLVSYSTALSSLTSGL